MLRRPMITGLFLMQCVGISALCASGLATRESPYLKAAVVCMNAKTDKEANLETFASYMAQAAGEGAHLIVFPEIALQQNPGWGPSSVPFSAADLDYVRDTAETIPGYSTDRLVRLARHYRMCVLFGMTEKGTDGKFYNTSVLIGPDGILGSYRKHRLWDGSIGGNEDRFWSRGNTPGLVIQSPLGKVGLMICVEMHYNFGPNLAAEGADFLATVSAWPASSGGLYESSTASNARVAGRWHFVANQTGTVGHAIDYGHSRIIRPDGVIVADTGRQEGVVVAETNLPIPGPVVDFNGDGTVDGRDVLILAAHWEQDKRAFDIAPVPFGDGVIDVEDLKVLAQYIGKDIDDPTLAGHWSFDEAEGMIAHDLAGGNNATILGLAQWQPEGGKIDGALELDGSTFATVDSPVNPADGPFSVLAWIQGGAPGQVLIAQVAGADWLAIDAVQGTLTTALAPAAGRKAIPPLVSDAVITDGNWHRVAFVWDGITRVLYVDETLVAEDAQTPLVPCSSGLHVGCDKDQTVGTFFTGLIDDVRIYRRTVRP